jgi:PLP dependent protein
MSTIADNIAQVEARIRAAALAVQRDVTSVHLLAVSKTKPAAALRDAYAAGLRDFGENYLQEALRQTGRISRPALVLALHRPHSIEQDARLSPSTSRGCIPWTASKLPNACPSNAADGLPPLNICIQVNVSGEASKSGCAPLTCRRWHEAIQALPRLTAARPDGDSRAH